MPQLPSGIQVAVDTTPLEELIANWHIEGVSEKLISLKTVGDLYPYTRILELVPAQQGVAPVHLMPGSLSLSRSMTARDTGYRLSDFPEGLVSWSPADRAAFQEFVNTRVATMLETDLATTQQRYAEICRNFLQRVESGWLKAGVHPSQEPGWDDWPEDRNIDVFDRLVALLQCRDAITAAGEEISGCNAIYRLDAFVDLAAEKFPWLPKSVLPSAKTAPVASDLRTALGAAHFEDDERSWWRDQSWHECNNLFNEAALEPFLMANAPKAYGVVRLASISKAGDVRD